VKEKIIEDIMGVCLNLYPSAFNKLTQMHFGANGGCCTIKIIIEQQMQLFRRQQIQHGFVMRLVVSKKMDSCGGFKAPTGS
jgi:hypothetical protein